MNILDAETPNQEGDPLRSGPVEMRHRWGYQGSSIGFWRGILEVQRNWDH